MMKTIKLYDKDSFISKFTAQVISCQKNKNVYETILDETAFFPEGGGQPADKGKIADAFVIDVQIKDGIITHFLDREVQGKVNCEIDWFTRFSRMQNHSGEHIVSGLVHRYTGLDNISFSLNDEEVSLAFNGEISDETTAKIEREANEAVFKNVAIIAEYPDENTLKTLNYRSKLELSSNIRIVTVEGYDVCACCAPHCKRSGEIGLIKIIDASKYKGGTKFKIQCGFSALKDYEMRLKQTQMISRIFSAKQNEVAAAAQKSAELNEKLKNEITALKFDKIKRSAELFTPCENNAVMKSEFSGDDLREFVNEVKMKIGSVAVGLNGDDTNGYRYVITSTSEDITQTVKSANKTLCGRGGGRDNMAQGTFNATFKEICRFFKVD